MKIEKKLIKDLNRAAYNPRVDLRPGDEEYEAILYSIEKYGLVQPIVWNQRTGNVISGHQRLTVLQNQGVQEVEVSVVDLDDIAEKQLNVALNKVEGSWDNDKLSELLTELGDDAYHTGFTQEEIDSLQNEITSYFNNDPNSEDDDYYNNDSGHSDDDFNEDEDGGYFCLTLTFNEDDRADIEAYIEEHGEKPIIRIILRKAKGEI